MKKVISLVLVMAMMLTVCSNAFAASVNGTNEAPTENGVRMGTDRASNGYLGLSSMKVYAYDADGYIYTLATGKVNYDYTNYTDDMWAQAEWSRFKQLKDMGCVGLYVEYTFMRSGNGTNRSPLPYHVRLGNDSTGAVFQSGTIPPGEFVTRTFTTDSMEEIFDFSIIYNYDYEERHIITFSAI